MKSSKITLAEQLLRHIATINTELRHVQAATTFQVITGEQIRMSIVGTTHPALFQTVRDAIIAHHTGLKQWAITQLADLNVEYDGD